MPGLFPLEPPCREEGCVCGGGGGGGGARNMHQDGKACSITTVFSFPDLWSVIADLGMRFGNVATPLTGR